MAVKGLKHNMIPLTSNSFPQASKWSEDDVRRFAYFSNVWSAEVANKMSKDNYKHIEERRCYQCMPDRVKRIMIRKVNNKIFTTECLFLEHQPSLYLR